jgi:hypothetical protein
MTQNQTFRGSDPTWANACVGNNGNPTYVDYAKGFSAAANLMLDTVMKDKGVKHPVDNFIYPICFNMRHSVELRLKGTVVHLIKLAKLKGSSINFDLSGSHDIGNIWSFVKSRAAKLDKRYSLFINELDGYIQDIADVDATGQIFRYPADSDSKKHLVDIAVINVLVLKTRFDELEKILDKMNEFNFFVEEEYSLGSFTANLSRAELFDLAYELPPRTTWSNIDFGSVKKTIMEKYGVSCRELSKAIKIIESNYEMGSLISTTPTLKGIDLKDLHIFFDEWVKLHDLERLKDSSKTFEVVNFCDVLMSERINEIDKLISVESECWKVLSKYLDFESVSGLKALYYFARDKYYSEVYVLNYERELSALSVLHEKRPDDYMDAVIHLLNKTNAFDNILTSLYFLGYAEFAENIIERYGLDGCFDWLDRARNRELFLKPELWGYKAY